MDAVTAITQVGSLFKAARSVLDSVKSKSGKSGAGGEFSTQLREHLAANALKFVQARDRDGSGGLDAAEFGRSGRLFARLDADGNGQITAAELVRAGKK